MQFADTHRFGEISHRLPAPVSFVPYLSQADPNVSPKHSKLLVKSQRTYTLPLLRIVLVGGG